MADIGDEFTLCTRRLLGQVACCKVVSDVHLHDQQAHRLALVGQQAHFGHLHVAHAAIGAMQALLVAYLPPNAQQLVAVRVIGLRLLRRQEVAVVPPQHLVA